MNKQEIMNLVSVLGKMKTLKRNGWLKRGVKDVESDAEHSFSTAFLVMLLAPQELDNLKCLKMALIHDLPEVLCGDFVPGEFSLKEKADLEQNAMRQIADNIAYTEIADLFDEFLAQETPEAKFVNAIDQLDNVFTARFYEDNVHKPLVREFWETAFPAVQQLPEEEGKKLLRLLVALS